jgi:hypothetical protein
VDSKVARKIQAEEQMRGVKADTEIAKVGVNI